MPGLGTRERAMAATSTVTMAVLVVVVVIGSLAMASSQNVSTECSDTFIRSCREPNTTAGFKSCCNALGGLFVTDQPCLCSLFQLINMTASEGMWFLRRCGVDTSGKILTCPGSSSGSSPSPPTSNSLPSPPPPFQQNHDRSNLDQPTQSSSASSSKSSSVPAIAGAVVGTVVVLCLVAVLVLVFLKKRRKSSASAYNLHLRSPCVDHAQPHPGVLGSSPTIFNYSKLYKATNGFSDGNLLGKGGFGSVHKGVLPDGTEIAVKQLKTDSWQGNNEFWAEVEIINRVHHKHLVSLFGHCISQEKMLLVYEYIPNKTLEFHLHENGEKSLGWSIRMKIAIGSAKGLAYLHEDCHPKIIHRDIKSANILIDYNFEAKVADFGLAKFCVDGSSRIITRVAGTVGYIAPEYAETGQVTNKSDVFSFGVMLLELITGRLPSWKPNTLMACSMLSWAKPLLVQALEDGNYDTFADPRLQKNYNSDEMARVVACALACVHYLPKSRPRIGQVVRILEGDISVEDLVRGLKRGESLSYDSPGGSNPNSSQYMVGKENFWKTIYSGEYTSSEYSGFTSEHDRSSTTRFSREA